MVDTRSRVDDMAVEPQGTRSDAEGGGAERGQELVPVSLPIMITRDMKRTLVEDLVSHSQGRGVAYSSRARRHLGV